MSIKSGKTKYFYYILAFKIGNFCNDSTLALTNADIYPSLVL